MKKPFEMLLTRAGAVSMLAVSVALLGGCGSDGGGGTTSNSVSGVVAQGAVQGAVVFADDVATSDYVMDDTEANYSATTDSNGSFSFKAPPYNYLIVTVGGTDSVTNQPAMQMIAPQGSADTSATKNVTPLTTLVALTPSANQAGVIAKIESLGLDSYDVDISSNNTTTPAATAFVQSIQSAVTAVTNTFDSSATSGGQSLSTATKNNIQREMLTQVADQVNQGTAGDLTDATAIGSALGAAASAAVTNVVGNSTINGGSTITITGAGAAAVRNTVATAATNVASNVLTSASEQGISTTAKTSETTVVTGTVATSNVAQTNSTVIDQTIADAGVTVTPLANTAPSISGTPDAATVGTAYLFTPTLTDPNANDVHIWTIEGSLPAGLTFNRATGVISGTPTTSGSVSVTISVSDGVAQSNSLTVSVTVGSTTGGSGTGG
jgi:hypothetical protein